MSGATGRHGHDVLVPVVMGRRRDTEPAPTQHQDLEVDLAPDAQTKVVGVEREIAQVLSKRQLEIR